MILVTLEGLPHSGRAAVLHHLTRRKSDWRFAHVDSGNFWAAALLKARALVPTAGAASKKVLVLGAPWCEIPKHPAVAKLARDLHAEVVRVLHARVDMHVMVHLRVPVHESFEQLIVAMHQGHVNSSLADLTMNQNAVAQETMSPSSPFPCLGFTVQCPAFFDDNECSLLDVVRQIEGIVNAVQDSRDPRDPQT